MRDVKADLVEYLRRNIDPSKLSIDFVPGNPDSPYESGDVSFPDYDAGLDFPGIYPATKDATIPNRGNLPFTGMDASGRGGTQNPIVTVQVDCWGGSKTTERVVDEGIDPGRIATELGKLVHKTCINNSVGFKDYSAIGAEPPVEAHDDQSDSMVRYREYVVVAMAYHEHPE